MRQFPTLQPGSTAQAVMHIFAQWHNLFRISLVVVAIACLTGCVDYDIGIRFDSPNRGEIVQRIQLGEQIQSLNGPNVQTWFKSVERHATSLGGRVQPNADQTITVKIPFNNSADLETKFNRFVETVLTTEDPTQANRLPPIRSHLTVKHSNFLLLEHNYLRYDVDLRSLGVQSASGEILVSPASLVTVEFALETPWGAYSHSRPDTLTPINSQNSHKLVWQLVPGVENTIESDFWLPSALGFGTLLIVLLVVVGTLLKYPQTLQPTKTPSLPQRS